MKQDKHKKRGRPETRVLKIDASPEYAAKAIFAAGKPEKVSKKKKKEK